MTHSRYEQRRKDVQLERELLIGLRSYELGQARKNVRWAEIDEALELALDADAAALAREQSATGDHQAQDALERAGQLDPALVDEVRQINANPRKAPAPVETDDPGLIRAIREALAEHRERGDAFDTAWARTVGRIQPNKGVSGVGRQALESTRACVEGRKHVLSVGSAAVVATGAGGSSGATQPNSASAGKAPALGPVNAGLIARLPQGGALR